MLTQIQASHREGETALTENTSAYLRLQAEAEWIHRPQSTTLVDATGQKRFVVHSRDLKRYGIGEMPSPNHKGGEPAVVFTVMTRIPTGP
jgi:hypothetical protein